MLSKKDLILPIILVLILLLSTIVVFAIYTNELIFYYKIKNFGLIEEGRIQKKFTLPKEKGLIPYINSSIKNHIFLIEYETDYKKYHCQLEVSKSTFDAFNKKDLINILYIIDKPAKCTLPNSVNLNYLLSLSLMIIGFLFMFLTVGFVYYIYTSFKKPPIGKPVKLTSNLELQNRQLTCPECGKLMSEGYLPTVGGVSWRYIDEPIGIPTILSGLPGTTFWIKRPKLHGYHCNECKVITFKYGTNKI